MKEREREYENILVKFAIASTNVGESVTVCDRKKEEAEILRSTFFTFRLHDGDNFAFFSNLVDSRKER